MNYGVLKFETDKIEMPDSYKLSNPSEEEWFSIRTPLRLIPASYYRINENKKLITAVSHGGTEKYPEYNGRLKIIGKKSRNRYTLKFKNGKLDKVKKTPSEQIKNFIDKHLNENK